MRPKLGEEARARAQAIFNHRRQQEIDASATSIATADKPAGHEMEFKRMRELKRPRSARKRNR